MRRDYIITSITEFIVLASGILVYKLAASYWGTDGFSEYALARRITSLIFPVLLVGFGVAIPRYIAFAQAGRKPKNRDSYFTVGLLIVGFTVTISVLVLNIFTDTFAFLFFGSSNYAYLILPVSLMLIGLSLHSMCYSYFRGTLKMRNANLLQITNFGIIPLIVFFIFGSTVSSVLIALSIFWALTSTIVILSMQLRLSTVDVMPHTKELLRYGLARVPGDFIHLAFLALPAIFTAHILGVKEAGFVAFGSTVLSMVGYLFTPISIILLPKASQMISRGEFSELRVHVFKIIKLSSALSILITIILEIFTEPIIRLYLGGTFAETVPIVRIVMLGALPYVLYICIRSVLDAFYEKAVNTVNLLIAFTAFVGFSLAVQFSSNDPQYILFAFVIGLYILGALSLLGIRRIFGGRYDT